MNLNVFCLRKKYGDVDMPMLRISLVITFVTHTPATSLLKNFIGWTVEYNGLILCKNNSLHKTCMMYKIVCTKLSYSLLSQCGITQQKCMWTGGLSKCVTPIEARSPVKIIEIKHPVTYLTMAYVYLQLCKYILLLLVNVLVVNSNWFQLLQSHTCSYSSSPFSCALDII